MLIETSRPNPPAHLPRVHGALGTALAPALVTALAAGCASGGGPPGHTFHLDPDLPPYCEVSRPAGVPPVEEALEAGPLRDWLGGRNGAEEGVVVLSVQRRPAGEDGGDWIFPMESSLSPERTEALIRRVREALGPRPEEGPAQSYRLRLDLGPDPRLETGPSLHCRPHMWNAADIIERLMPVVREAALAGGVQVVAEWVVERDGSSRVSRLVQGSGDADLDREIVAVLRRARFRPGHVDGSPLQVYPQAPFNFGIPR